MRWISSLLLPLTVSIILPAKGEASSFNISMDGPSGIIAIDQYDAKAVFFVRVRVFAD
jgi:hypothetical protein